MREEEERESQRELRSFFFSVVFFPFLFSSFLFTRILTRQGEKPEAEIFE